MDRYFIASIDAYVRHYPVCDQRQGGRREPVAIAMDGEIAERIVRLLNADERLRMQASLKGSPE